MTLLIVDQRPSQIYDEVMSQLGTRISGWLGDDLDPSRIIRFIWTGRPARYGKNHRGATPTEGGSSAVGLGRADAVCLPAGVTQV